MTITEATRLVDHAVLSLRQLDAGGRHLPREEDAEIARAADAVMASARMLIDAVRDSYPSTVRGDES